MTDNPLTPLHATSAQRLSARAFRLGRRLKLTSLEAADLNQAEAVATSPLLLRLRGGGSAALLPYGTVVLIGVSQGEEEAFLQKLGDRVEGRLDAPVIVTSEIEIGASDKISGDVITVRNLSPPRLVVVVDALAKNVALASEEEEIRNLIDVREPFDRDLANTRQLPCRRERMMRTVRNARLTEHRLICRIENRKRTSSYTMNGFKLCICICISVKIGCSKSS